MIHDAVSILPLAVIREIAIRERCIRLMYSSETSNQRQAHRGEERERGGGEDSRIDG